MRALQSQEANGRVRPAVLIELVPVQLQRGAGGIGQQVNLRTHRQAHSLQLLCKAETSQDVQCALAQAQALMPKAVKHANLYVRRSGRDVVVSMFPDASSNARVHIWLVIVAFLHQADLACATLKLQDYVFGECGARRRQP